MNRYKLKNQLVLGSLLGLSAVITGCGGGGAGTAAAGAGAGPETVAGATFTVTPLGGSGGANFSDAVSINSSGMVVGSYAAPTQVTAAKWDSANPTFPQVALLPLTGGDYSAAYGINNGNITVGEADDAAGAIMAVNWPADSTIAVTLNQDTLTGNNAAYSINATNATVGEADVNGITMAVLWPSLTDAPVLLQHLGATNPCSSAYFISSTGVIVGESRGDDGKLHAVMWAPVSGVYGAPVAMAQLSPAQVASVALGIDAAGHIVGEAELSDGVVHGMVWDAAGTMVNDLGAATSAQAINNTDRIVGYVDALSGAERAAVFNRNNVNDRNLSDPVSQAYAVNDVTTFVGVKDNRAFVAKHN